MNIKNFIPRDYQESIKNTCLNNNTLVILPTGLGKTKIALLTSIDRLKNFQNSKVLFLTPTKPLASQIYSEFIDYTDVDKEKISMLTGKNKPDERIGLFNKSSIIIATPQTIQKDIENNRISLENVSLLCIDEAHRSRQKFANTIVAKNFIENSKNQRIIALTASPGGNREKINDIINNLFIESVEIRTENSEDVSEYIQKKENEWITIEFSGAIKVLHNEIKKVYDNKMLELKKFGIYKPTNLITKKDLLGLQIRFRDWIRDNNPLAYRGIVLTSQLIKIDYALELLETQTLKSALKFLEKIKDDPSKSAKSLIKEYWFEDCLKKINKMIDEGIENPKINKMIEIIKAQLEINKDSKIMIFVNFRNTVDEITERLNKIQDIRAIKLVGQKDGVSQKTQISSIKKFEDGVFNVLVGTSISEEGLNISGGSDLAIFYDNVSTSIRRIQRSGRVGRIKAGRIIFLMNKDTRDIAYYWKSKKEEVKMRNILNNMKEKKFIQRNLK